MSFLVRWRIVRGKVRFDPGFAEKGQGHGPDVPGERPGSGFEQGRFAAGPVPLPFLQEAAQPASREMNEPGPRDEAGQALLDLPAAHEAARKRAPLTGGPRPGFEDVGGGAGQPGQAARAGFERVRRLAGGNGRPGEEVAPEPRVVTGGLLEDRDPPAQAEPGGDGQPPDG